MADIVLPLVLTLGINHNENIICSADHPFRFGLLIRDRAGLDHVWLQTRSNPGDAGTDVLASITDPVIRDKRNLGMGRRSVPAAFTESKRRTRS